MAMKDPRIDAYIAKSADFAKWITEAKREETRSKRLATAIAWMATGKPRHWKYANC